MKLISDGTIFGTKLFDNKEQLIENVKQVSVETFVVGTSLKPLVFIKFHENNCDATKTYAVKNLVLELEEVE